MPKNCNQTKKKSAEKFDSAIRQVANKLRKMKAVEEAVLRADLDFPVKPWIIGEFDRHG